MADPTPPVETVHQRIDRVSYDMYVDCGCDATAAAHQLGTTARTVRARVARHASRIDTYALVGARRG